MQNFKIKNGQVVELTQAEIDARDAKTISPTAEFDAAMRDLRLERDALLANTDWWDNSDTPPMTQAQLDYRQNLRDVTNGLTSVADVENVIMPTYQP